jgi:hypothetical protein
MGHKSSRKIELCDWCFGILNRYRFTYCVARCDDPAGEAGLQREKTSYPLNHRVSRLASFVRQFKCQTSHFRVNTDRFYCGKQVEDRLYCRTAFARLRGSRQRPTLMVEARPPRDERSHPYHTFIPLHCPLRNLDCLLDCPLAAVTCILC